MAMHACGSRQSVGKISYDRHLLVELPRRNAVGGQIFYSRTSDQRMIGIPSWISQTKPETLEGPMSHLT